MHGWIRKAAATCGALLLTGWSGCARHHSQHTDLTAGEMVAKLDRGAAWMFWKVDAEPEQREKVSAVIEAVKPEVVRWQQERGALKRNFVRVLAADAISAEEVEKLRTAGRALTAQAFDRSFDALVQMAEVLTPEQRKTLIESWDKHL